MKGAVWQTVEIVSFGFLGISGLRFPGVSVIETRRPLFFSVGVQPCQSLGRASGEVKAVRCPAPRMADPHTRHRYYPPFAGSAWSSRGKDDAAQSVMVGLA